MQAGCSAVLLLASRLCKTTLFFLLTLRRRFLLLPFTCSCFFFCSGGVLELLEVVEVLEDRGRLQGLDLCRFLGLDLGVQSRYAILLRGGAASAAFRSALVFASELLETACTARAVVESFFSASGFGSPNGASRPSFLCFLLPCNLFSFHLLPALMDLCLLGL